MGFKESVARDIANVFLNTDEFAELHTIKFDDETYSNIPVVTQKITQSDRTVLQDDHVQGIYKLSMRAYFNSVDTNGHIPEQGKSFEINDGEALGKPFFQRCRVATAENKMGLICLELEAFDE